MGLKPQVLSIDPSDKVLKTDGCQPRQTTTTVSADCGAIGEFRASAAEAQLHSNVDSFNAAARQLVWTAIAVALDGRQSDGLC